MSIYEFNFNSIDGEFKSFKDYSGKALLIVNTASKCGFTPQYEGLEALYKKYADKGLEIIGFPCDQFANQEPGSNDEVKNFCSINYGVTFPLSEKVEVRGEHAHPLFRYLTDNTEFKGFDMDHPIGKGLLEFLSEKFPEFLEGNSIKWNFTKFLIDRNGTLVKRYEPTSDIPEIEKDLANVL